MKFESSPFNGRPPLRQPDYADRKNHQFCAVGFGWYLGDM